MITYLLALSQDLTDHAIEIYDKQMMVLQQKGRKVQEKKAKTKSKSVNEKVVFYADIGSVVCIINSFL